MTEPNSSHPNESPNDLEREVPSTHRSAETVKAQTHVAASPPSDDELPRREAQHWFLRFEVPILVVGSGLVLLAALVHSAGFLTRPVFLLIAVMAMVWFLIGLVVFAKPPGVPIFKANPKAEFGFDIVREDPFLAQPFWRRIAWALTLSSVICGVLWVWLIVNRQPV
jgi:hypothetical protein